MPEDTDATTEATTNTDENVTHESDDAENSENANDVDFWKQKARSWETRSKQNYNEKKALEEAAQKWAAHEESQKTEAQKSAERLAQVEADAKAAKVELYKYKIAAEKGLTQDALSLLDGDTEEALAVKADALLALLGSKKSPTVQPTRTQGAGTGSTQPLDWREEFRLANQE